MTVSLTEALFLFTIVTSLSNDVIYSDKGRNCYIYFTVYNTTTTRVEIKNVLYQRFGFYLLLLDKQIRLSILVFK